MMIAHIASLSRRVTSLCAACLFMLAASLLAGCGGSGSSPSATSFATAYAGTWAGSWTDINGTSGTSSMVIALNSATGAATVTITLSGGQFGFVGSQSALTGTYNTNSITVSGPSGQTAVATLVINSNGQFTGSATNVSATVTSVTYSGPSTSQSVTLNVAVHHSDGTTETGTITLTKASV
jgi:hypothetical protein